MKNRGIFPARNDPINITNTKDINMNVSSIFENFLLPKTFTWINEFLKNRQDSQKLHKNNCKSTRWTNISLTVHVFTFLIEMPDTKTYGRFDNFPFPHSGIIFYYVGHRFERTTARSRRHFWQIKDNTMKINMNFKILFYWTKIHAKWICWLYFKILTRGETFWCWMRWVIY